MVGVDSVLPEIFLRVLFNRFYISFHMACLSHSCQHCQGICMSKHINIMYIFLGNTSKIWLIIGIFTVLLALPFVIYAVKVLLRCINYVFFPSLKPSSNIDEVCYFLYIFFCQQLGNEQEMCLISTGYIQVFLISGK